MKKYLYTCLSTAVISALLIFLLGSLGLDVSSIGRTGTSVQMMIIFCAATGSFLYFNNKEKEGHEEN